MSTYRITFSNGDTEDVEADDYRRWEGLITTLDWNGRSIKSYIEANLRSIEKVTR